MLRAKVVKYANDQKLNTNYIYFTAPTAKTLDGFSLQAPADRDDVGQCHIISVVRWDLYVAWVGRSRNQEIKCIDVARGRYLRGRNI